jgi:hypothetical protein
VDDFATRALNKDRSETREKKKLSSRALLDYHYAVNRSAPNKACNEPQTQKSQKSSRNRKKRDLRVISPFVSGSNPALGTNHFLSEKNLS